MAEQKLASDGAD